MDGEVKLESIKDLLKVIAALKEAGRQEEAEEHLSALFDILFAGKYLKTIVSEKLINEIDFIFTSYDVWSKFPHYKDEFNQWKSLIHDIQSKLCAVLELRFDIETLLFSKLRNWPIVGEILVDFSQNNKEQLQIIRERTNNSPSAILDTFFPSYFSQLGDKISSDVKQLIFNACNEYKKLEQQSDCLALFVEGTLGVISNIQIKLAVGNGEITSPTNVKPAMQQQANIAITQTLQILGLHGYHVTWMIERPNIYDGTSIGLPLAVALIKKLDPKIRVDCFSAFTGEIDFQTDAVKRVGRIIEKLKGASNSGIRRIFIPKDNEEDVQNFSIPDLEIIFVQSISETRTKLAAFSVPMKIVQTEPTTDAQIKFFETKCKSKGLSVIPGKDIGTYGRQLVVSNFKQEIPVNIYFGRKGLNWIVNGNKRLELNDLVNQICVEVFGQIPEATAPQENSKWTIKDTTIRSTVETLLRSFTNWKVETEKNCQYRLDFSKGKEVVQVRQFSSGTLTVRGIPAGTQLFTEICQVVNLSLGISENSSITSTATTSFESTKSDKSLNRKPIPASAASWIGTDEAGKGDYFGPLVSAGVCIDKEVEKELRGLGVKDSKLLSDSRNMELAKNIRIICRDKYAEVLIPPRTYNNLYAQFKRENKNLNALLAWGHARAIEDILKKVHCEYALADQFADEHYIISKLQEAGRKIVLFQMHKAEEDIAVAAASILARDRFLSYIDKITHDYNLKFLKGASLEVIQTAKNFISKYGEEKLGEVAKLHFRTTKEVLNGKQIIE